MSQEQLLKGKAYATPYHLPTPASPGIEGCGESVSFNDKLYFYRTAKAIPRTGKVVFVKYEGGWNHGVTPTVVEFLAIAWKGKKFIVFATATKLKHLSEWRNLTIPQAEALLSVKLKIIADEQAKYAKLDWSRLV